MPAAEKTLNACIMILDIEKVFSSEDMAFVNFLENLDVRIVKD